MVIVKILYSKSVKILYSKSEYTIKEFIPNAYIIYHNWVSVVEQV